MNTQNRRRLKYLAVTAVLCGCFLWYGISMLRAGTAYYVDKSLGAPCLSGNYSISAHACTGTDGNAYTTIAAGVAVLTPGDTLYLRGGTYSEQINLATPTLKNGTAGFPITIGGYPGDSKPILNGVANGYGLVRAWNNNYIIIQDLVLDGANMTGNGGIWANGNHDVIYQRLEIKNQNTSAFYLDGNAYNITIKDNYIHDARSDCAVGNRWYAAYVHTASNVTFTGNWVENMPGGGGQLYPGNVSNTTIKGNVFKNVSYCQTSKLGGWLIGPALNNTVNNTVIADNIFIHLGYAYANGTGGYANGVTVDSRGTTSNTLIANNTFYDLHRVTGGQAYAILIRTNLETGLVVKNNVMDTLDDDAITNSSASAVISNNACTAAKNCGSTAKVTIANIGDCVINAAAGDFRLKQGTNPCRNAGAPVTSRQNPIGAVDIGAYEQGAISSASVVGGYIEAITSIMSPGIRPATGITAFTVACVGCAGTPVVSSAVVKAGTQNIVQLSISGITTNGTCTISVGSTNATDSYMVGGPNGSAQGINSVSGQSVTGTCQNTAGGGGGGGAPSISISGPSNGDVSVALTYTGTATNCTPSANGWTWTTDGGTGSSTTNSINITWGSSGTKVPTATNSNCGAAQGSKSVIITPGGGSDPGDLWSDFKLDEGSGTTANDASGLAHHGTVSAGVTWTTGGVQIPTDTTYRSIASTYGSGIDPTTQDYSICAYGLPDVSNSQKVVMSSTTNGTGQRAYFGWYTIAGQPQWGIGIQNSGFTTGSEFVATNKLTLVCLINDSAIATATLYVDAVAGTVAGASVKTETSYILTGNFLAGNDGTNTINNGGFTIYEMWVYNKALSAAEVKTLYSSLSPSSPNPPCLSQVATQFQLVYTENGAAVPLGLRPDGSVDVTVNGGVAVMIQLNCTGANGSSVSLRPYYSLDGVNFSLPVPQVVGIGNIGMWGSDNSGWLNDGPITTCLAASGLSQDAGFTVVDSVVSPTLTMAQDHCLVSRWIFRTGQKADISIWIRLLSDAGQPIANGYPLDAKINLISPQGGVF